jgi:large subunit ribosomal protein L11
VPEIINLLVVGGEASAGPPLGPTLGPLGINLMEVVSAINQKTQAYQGMKVPVKVIVDKASKSFEIEVGTPPVSSLLKNELGIEKGSPATPTQKAGNLDFEKVIKIAQLKKGSLTGKTLKEKVKEVLGSCFSMGITVDNKNSREVQKEIAQGKYDKMFQ